MTDGLPVISGEALVRALRRAGWEVRRQRGSHVRLHHPDRRSFVTVPLHRELKRGTLRGILRDVEMGADALRELL